MNLAYTSTPPPLAQFHNQPTASQPDQIPIDPALVLPQIDPAILADQNGVSSPSQLAPQPQFPYYSGQHLQHPEHAQQPEQAYAYQQSSPLPSHRFDSEPRQYSQGPQGDPFAPPPPSHYIPLEPEPAPVPTKPTRRKRRHPHPDHCATCDGDNSRNKQDIPEEMVTCVECSRNEHPSCLSLEFPPYLPWRCTECKICEICKDKGDDAKIMFCDHCDRGWHRDCLTPPLDETPQGKWHCPECPPVGAMPPMDIATGHPPFTVDHNGQHHPQHPPPFPMHNPVQPFPYPDQVDSPHPGAFAPHLPQHMYPGRLPPPPPNGVYQTPGMPNGTVAHEPIAEYAMMAEVPRASSVASSSRSGLRGIGRPRKSTAKGKAKAREAANLFTDEEDGGGNMNGKGSGQELNNNAETPSPGTRRINRSSGRKLRAVKEELVSDGHVDGADDEGSAGEEDIEGRQGDEGESQDDEADGEGEDEEPAEEEPNTPRPTKRIKLSHKSRSSKSRSKAALKVNATPKSRSKARPIRQPKHPPNQPSSPTPERPLPRVRLRLTVKGKERDTDAEQPKGLFDDLLAEADRDVTRTNILESDKAKFERSRLIAEEKLAPPPRPPSPDEVDPPIPGPSRPLRSSHHHHLHPPISTSHSFATLPTPAGASASPVPSTPGGADPNHTHASSGSILRIQTIRFGPWDIQTWFDAPFPEEYASIPDGRLWICEFCLKYMKSRFGAQRHKLKCKVRHPPGDEIYRDGVVSIFEVDGRKNKIYCQNLCLLSKMFLDHKSLFYDVEPFLFYVVTVTDDLGAHFVGYFSKEKRCSKDYNLSCIMTLPVRQRQGWGNLLIDFSYLLSKKEQRAGSPEKPLSGLGALGYRNYWTLAVMRFLATAPEMDHDLRLEDISTGTSMTIEDICNTLNHLNLLTLRETTPPTPARARPSPGQSIKFVKGRKNGIARRALQRTQTQDSSAGAHDDANGNKGPFVAPKSYAITWDREAAMEHMRVWEAKGYVTLKPEKLKWTPFLVGREPKVGLGVADGSVLEVGAHQAEPVAGGAGQDRRSDEPSAAPMPDLFSPELIPAKDSLDLQAVSEALPSPTSLVLELPTTTPAPTRSLRNRSQPSPVVAPSTPASVLRPRRAGMITRTASRGPKADDVVMEEASPLTRKSTQRRGRPAQPSTPSPVSLRPRVSSPLEQQQQEEDDEALAARLSLEEQRPMRALRSRQNSSQITPQVQSVQIVQTLKQKPVVRKASSRRSASPRKRRRVESSPEEDAERSRSSDEVPMQVDTPQQVVALSASPLPDAVMNGVHDRARVVSRESNAPSGSPFDESKLLELVAAAECMQKLPITDEHRAPAESREETPPPPPPVMVCGDGEGMMVDDEGLSDADADADADADGEYEEDAEGEPDTEEVFLM
ncbi:hypothetical protein HGRIS_003570 [Hohenbuehelia grisea]|uniref:Histone acetyltransferase n=1 Tax=Hohenbuehelia grisea TaxID=104357 RepID=A0ABR3JHJ5_9AGAR